MHKFKKGDKVIFTSDRFPHKAGDIATIAAYRYEGLYGLKLDKPMTCHLFLPESWTDFPVEYMGIGEELHLRKISSGKIHLRE